MKAKYRLKLPDGTQAKVRMLYLGGRQWVMTPIHMPSRFAGQGLRSQLLKLVTDDADIERVTLILSRPTHKDWYESRGFENDGSWMKKKPQPCK